MITRLVSRLDLRSTIFAVLITALSLSLVYSLSFQFGHADVPIAENAELVQPLGVGESAPRFMVRTVADEPFEFDPRELERPVLLISFRGGWCPYCNMHLAELRHVLPQIQSMGIDVYFLSGDRPEILYDSLKRETREQIEGLDYTILSDSDAQAAIAFGVAFRSGGTLLERRRIKGDDVADSSMERHGVLPVPSVYAIDKQGVIAFVYANPDYKIRLHADELLAVATKLAR